MSEMESSSSSEPGSSSQYKAIIAIGVIGTEEDVTRFIALWVTDAEKRAHRINDGLFAGRLQLLPLPEES